jgi:hypothetical protein
MNADENEDRVSIERLLGPTGHHASCERCFELIDQYVELELAGVDVDACFPGLRRHLDGCRACWEDHKSLRLLVGAKPRRPRSFEVHR